MGRYFRPFFTDEKFSKFWFLASFALCSYHSFVVVFKLAIEFSVAIHAYPIVEFMFSFVSDFFEKVSGKVLIPSLCPLRWNFILGLAADSPYFTLYSFVFRILFFFLDFCYNSIRFEVVELFWYQKSFEAENFGEFLPKDMHANVVDVIHPLHYVKVFDLSPLFEGFFSRVLHWFLVKVFKCFFILKQCCLT